MKPNSKIYFLTCHPLKVSLKSYIILSVVLHLKEETLLLFITTLNENECYDKIKIKQNKKRKLTKRRVF